MSEINVEEKVRKIICNQLAIEPEKVTKSASITDDLGADSLDQAEIMMNMEEEFDLDIPDEESAQFKTVGDVIGYIQKKGNA